MASLRLRNVLLIIAIAIGVFALSACTRSASTPPPSTEESGPTGAQSETQATMDAVRSAILTQTAQATAGDLPTATATPPPAETEGTTTEGTPGAADSTATPLTGELEYTVQPGDWIFKIAREFNVDPQAIIDLNNLTNPSSLSPGTVLKIPSSSVVEPPTDATPDTTPVATAVATDGTPTSGTTVHVVQPGEWIWQIARLYGVDPQAIIDANNLVNPSSISPGDELIIP
jgi:LysM repeat protein